MIYLVILFCYTCAAQAYPISEWKLKSCYKYDASVSTSYQDSPVDHARNCTAKCIDAGYAFAVMHKGREKAMCNCYQDVTRFVPCSGCRKNVCPYTIYSSKIVLIESISVISTIVFKDVNLTFQIVTILNNKSLTLEDFSSIQITVNDTNLTGSQDFFINNKHQLIIPTDLLSEGDNLVSINATDATGHLLSNVWHILKLPQFPIISINGTYITLKNGSIAVRTKDCISFCFVVNMPFSNISISITPDNFHQTFFPHSSQLFCHCDVKLGNLQFQKAGMYSLSFAIFYNGYQYSEKKENFIIVEDVIHSVCVTPLSTFLGIPKTFKAIVEDAKYNVQFEWYFGNVTEPIRTTQPYCTFNIRKEFGSIKHVTVVASNLVSRNESKHTILAEPDLRYLSIVAPPNPLIMGERVALKINISSLDNLEVKWTIEYKKLDVVVQTNERNYYFTPGFAAKAKCSVQIYGKLSEGKAETDLCILKKIQRFEVHSYNQNQSNVKFIGDISDLEYSAIYFDQRYDLKVSWHFDDGITHETKNMQLTHNFKLDDPKKCAKVCKYYVTINASNIVSYMVVKKLVVLFPKPCNVRVYWSWNKNLIKEYSLSDDIFFWPTININCSVFDNITFAWRIMNMENKVVLRRNISNFVIPATAFGLGEFSFNFIVTVNEQVIHNITGTIRIKKSGLKAVIHNGTSMDISGRILIGNRSHVLPITLNGSNSHDIDYPKMKAHLKYDWNCYVDPNNLKSSCFKEGVKKDMSQPMLSILIDELRYTKKYLFVLKISKAGYRTVNASVEIQFKETLRKLVHIFCNSCVQARTSAADKAIFVSNIPIHEDLVFIWKIYKEKRSLSILERTHGKCMNTTLPVNPSKFYEDIKWSYGYSMPSYLPSLDDKPTCIFNASERQADCHRISEEGCSYYIGNVSRLKSKINETIVKNNKKQDNRFSLGKIPSPTFHHVPPKIEKQREIKYSEGRFGKIRNFLEELTINYRDTDIADPNYLYGKNHRILVLQQHTLLPQHMYMVTLEVKDKKKQPVGMAWFRFNTFPIPTYDNCEFVSDMKLEEVTGVFEITCRNLKGKYPLTFTLQTQNPITGSFDFVLTTKEYMLSFVLPHYGTRFHINLRLTIETPYSNTTVCFLKAYVQKNKLINLHYINKMVSDPEKLFLFEKVYQKMNKLSVVLTTLNRMKFSTELLQVHSKICGILKDFSNKHQVDKNYIRMLFDIMKKMTFRVKVLCVCMDWIVEQMEDIIVNKADLMQFLQSKNDHHNVVDDFSKILNAAFLYYDRNKDYEKSMKILWIQRRFLHKLGENYYNETYMFYSSSSLLVIGRKMYGTLQDLNIHGVKITINERKPESYVEQCYDISAAVFIPKYISWAQKDKHMKCDIRLLDCSESLQTSPQLSYDISMPTNRDFFLKWPNKYFLLKWNHVNKHIFNMKAESEFVEIFIKFFEKSKISSHFDVDIQIYTVSGNESGFSMNYPLDCRGDFCSITHQIPGKQLFNVRLEIKASFSKVVDEPWFNYSISISKVTCQTWVMTDDIPGINRFCVPTNKSEEDSITCRCSKPLMVSGYIEDIPYTTEELNLEQIIYGAILPIYFLSGCLVVCMFLALLFWKHENCFRQTAIALAENHPCDNYKYSILVETGHMYGAGTSSRICAILHGTKGHSEKMELTYGDKQMFQRSCTDMVLINCPHHLGDLTHLNLWHNNEGSSPDWYIKQVVVNDVMAGKISYFPFHNWLSLTKGIHNVTCRLITTNETCLSNFQIICEKLLDQHLCLSVFVGPLRTPFSKFERLCCIMVSVVFYVVSTLIFFKDFIQKNKSLVSLLHITSGQPFLLGFITVLSHYPIYFLLTSFFRNSALQSEWKGHKQKKVKKKIVKKSQIDIYQSNTESINDSSAFEMNYLGALYYKHFMEDQISISALSLQKQEIKNVPKVFSFPQYFRAVGLVISFCIILFGCLFSMWKAQYLPEDLSIAWLQLILICLFLDIFFVNVFVAITGSYFTTATSLFGKSYACLFHILEKRIENRALFGRKGISVRHRARFIRYAQPLKSNETYKKKLRLEKKELFKKTLMKVLACMLLLFFSVLLFPEDVTEINLANAHLKATFNLPEGCKIHDFWNWSVTVIPQFVNYENWQYRFNRDISPATDVDLWILGRAEIERSSSNGTESVGFIGNKENVTDILENLYSVWKENVTDIVGNSGKWFNNSVNITKENVTDIVGNSGKWFNNSVNITKENVTDIVGNSGKWFNNSVNITKKNVTDIVGNSGKSFKNSVNLIKYRFNLMKMTGKPLYSYVEVGFPMIPALTVETFRINCGFSVECLRFVIGEIFLGIMISLLLAYGYNRFLECGWFILFKWSSLLDMVVIAFGSVVCVSCLLDKMAIFYLRGYFLNMEFNNHEVHQVFINTQSIITLKKVLLFSKGGFMFFAALKCLYILKLNPVTSIHLKVLKTSFTGVASYTVYIMVLVVGFSIYWRLIHCSPFPSIWMSMEYVMLHYQRLLPEIDKIKDCLTEVHFFLSVVMSFVAWLSVRMSCIFFLGALTRRKKRRMRKKNITLGWLLKKGWYYFKGYSSLNKRYHLHSKIPKKYVFEEIDYQLEEVLYRVNKLAESEHVVDSESSSDDSDADTSLCYTTGQSASKLSATDQYSRRANTDAFSHTINTLKSHNSSTLQGSLGSSRVSRIRDVEGRFQRNSIGSFKRFSLASIMENRPIDSMINEPIEPSLILEKDEGDDEMAWPDQYQRNNDQLKTFKDFSEVQRIFNRVILPSPSSENEYSVKIRKGIEEKFRSRKRLSPKEAENRLHDIATEAVIMEEDQDIFSSIVSKDSGLASLNSQSLVSKTPSEESSSVKGTRSQESVKSAHIKRDTSISIEPAFNQYAFQKVFGRPKLSKEIVEAERRNAEVYKSLFNRSKRTTHQ